MKLKNMNVPYHPDYMTSHSLTRWAEFADRLNPGLGRYMFMMQWVIDMGIPLLPSLESDDPVLTDFDMCGHVATRSRNAELYQAAVKWLNERQFSYVAPEGVPQ